MKIEGSVQELELFFKKFTLKENMIVIPKEIPPHEFPSLNQELFQHTNNNLPKYSCNNNPPS